MGLSDDMVKVLWPDGPRHVPASEIVTAALDALCNEEGLGAGIEDEGRWRALVEATRREMSLDEAIEIVNHHGYYTTARREFSEGDGPPHDHATAMGLYDRD